MQIIENIKSPLAEQISEFLSNTNIGEYHIAAIAPDWSARNYYRIKAKEKSYILMHCPPNYQSLDSYIAATEFFLDNGFSVPKIFTNNKKYGFLLLSDFGELKLNKLINIKSHKTQKLYSLALDNLIKLNSISTTNYNFPKHDFEKISDGFTLYQTQCLATKHHQEFQKLYTKLLSSLNTEQTVLVHRDYHLDNLFFLEKETGYRQIGIIDHQDLSLGYASYDLVSLLQDARRYVTIEEQQQYYNYFTKQIDNLDTDYFALEYEIFSLQRNLRIIGLIHKYIKEKGRNSLKHYVATCQKYLGQNYKNPLIKKIIKICEI